MKKFIRHIVLFSVFPVLFAAVHMVPLYVTGEFMHPARIVAHQAEHNVLCGMAYSNPEAGIKVEGMKLRQPQIVILGTSRVLCFRGEFFSEPDAFFNAGRAIVRLGDCRAFFEAVPMDTVRILIIGLDQYFFNVHWDDFLDSPRDYTDVTTVRDVLDAQTLWKDWRDGKFDGKRLLNSPHIGMSARMKDTGFRADGSREDGDGGDAPSPPEFSETLQRIAAGSDRFSYAETVNEVAVQELDDVLAYCEQRNIHVVGLLPPFAHAVWGDMMSRGSDYAYMRNLQATLQPLFQRRDYPLFDFSDLVVTGAGDDEATDGFHVSEVAALRMVIHMAENSPVLAQEVSLPLLTAALEQAHSAYRVWPQESN